MSGAIAQRNAVDRLQKVSSCAPLGSKHLYCHRVCTTPMYLPLPQVEHLEIGHSQGSRPHHWQLLPVLTLCSESLVYEESVLAHERPLGLMGRAHCLSRNDRWRIVQLTGELTRRHEGQRLGCSLFRGGLSQKTDGEVRFTHRGLLASILGEKASTKLGAVQSSPRSSNSETRSGRH